jgi:hypothetical protein
MTTKNTDRISELIQRGQIRLRMTRSEVRKLLGEPDDVGGTSRRNRTPAILKYGEVEFHFGRQARDGLNLVYYEQNDTEPGITLLR